MFGPRFGPLHPDLAEEEAKSRRRRRNKKKRKKKKRRSCTFVKIYRPSPGRWAKTYIS